MCALRLVLGMALFLGMARQGALGQRPDAEVEHGLEQSAPPGGQGTGVLRGPSSTDLERRTSALASELRCPVCQGVSVEDSPTELARQMRATVRDQLAAGRSADEVRQYFVDRYGEWILLEPRPAGFNLLVYVLPWLVVLAGLTVIVVAVRRWTRPQPANAPLERATVAPTLDS